MIFSPSPIDTPYLLWEDTALSADSEAVEFFSAGPPPARLSPLAEKVWKVARHGAFASDLLAVDPSHEAVSDALDSLVHQGLLFGVACWDQPFKHWGTRFRLALSGSQKTLHDPSSQALLTYEADCPSLYTAWAGILASPSLMQVHNAAWWEDVLIQTAIEAVRDRRATFEQTSGSEWAVGHV